LPTARRNPRTAARLHLRGEVAEGGGIFENEPNLPSLFCQLRGMKQTSPSSEKAWLRRVRVRLIEEHEHVRFDELLEKQHLPAQCPPRGPPPAPRGRGRGPMGGPDRLQRAGPARPSPGSQDRLDPAPTGPAAASGGQEQPFPGPGGSEAPSQPGLASPALCLKRLSRHGQPKLQRSLTTAAAMHGRQESGAFGTQELGADVLWGAQRQSGRHPGAGARAAAPAVFSPEHHTGWSKEPGRLVRWQIQRVSVSPEKAGCCGGGSQPTGQAPPAEFAAPGSAVCRRAGVRRRFWMGAHGALRTPPPHADERVLLQRTGAESGTRHLTGPAVWCAWFRTLTRRRSLSLIVGPPSAPKDRQPHTNNRVEDDYEDNSVLVSGFTRNDPRLRLGRPGWRRDSRSSRASWRFTTATRSP